MNLIALIHGLLYAARSVRRCVKGGFLLICICTSLTSKQINKYMPDRTLAFSWQSRNFLRIKLL